MENSPKVLIVEDDDLVALAPGMTLVFPPHVRHQFRTLGGAPLKTLGVHASPHRIVIVHEDNLGMENDRPVGPKRTLQG